MPLPHFHQDPFHICTRTGLAPFPHLRRDLQAQFGIAADRTVRKSAQWPPFPDDPNATVRLPLSLTRTTR